MHPVDEIFRAFDDSPTKLANATGSKVQTVWDWKRDPAEIPPWRRPAVLDAVKREGISLSKNALAYLASEVRPPRKPSPESAAA